MLTDLLAIIEIAILYLLAGFAGLFVVLMILPVIPGAVDALTNKPNRFRPEGQADDNHERITPAYEASLFGFFTYLQPGRSKMIERGDSFVRAIMRLEGHMFRGERPTNDLTPSDPDYYDVEASRRGDNKYNDSHPLPFPKKDGAWRLIWLLYAPLSILWWIWKRWTYFITGAVFTGIYPFQKVRVYPLEHSRKITLGSGEIRIVRIVDWSDHYRVADFQFPSRIPQADTQDKIPVSITTNTIARTVNPYRIAYETDDDWGSRLYASKANAITTYTRSRPLDVVLSAKDPGSAASFSQTVVTEINDKIGRIGIRIIDEQVLDISPDATYSRKLGDLAVARVDRQAREERAKGDAAPIREMGAALREFPEAEVVPRVEGLIRAAGAVSKEAIVMLGGNFIDPGQAAVVKELRRQKPITSTEKPDA